MGRYYIVKKKGDYRYFHESITMLGSRKTVLSKEKILAEDAERYLSLELAKRAIENYIQDKKTIKMDDFEILDISIICVANKTYTAKGEEIRDEKTFLH